MDTAPRIAPGGRNEIGLVNALITRLLGTATSGSPPNVFTTLAIHRRLFRRWLLFASALIPGGRLPRIDTELVILRVSHNCNCAYEWRHHGPGMKNGDGQTAIFNSKSSSSTTRGYVRHDLISHLGTLDLRVPWSRSQSPWISPLEG